MIEYFVGTPFSCNCPCLITKYCIVLGQRWHFSIKTLLSQLKIKEDLDPNYKEQQVLITKDSFN